MAKDESVYFAVYATLVALTLITAASYFAGFGPLLGVVFALSIAAMKTSLIAYYFMHLKTESALIYAVALSGLVAVLILAAGIIPDIALGLYG